jgi:hypothetical protein
MRILAWLLKFDKVRNTLKDYLLSNKKAII